MASFSQTGIYILISTTFVVVSRVGRLGVTGALKGIWLSCRVLEAMSARSITSADFVM